MGSTAEYVADRDYTIDQAWDRYSDDEHDRWRALYARQIGLLPARACPAFLDGLEMLDLNQGGVVDFARINKRLGELTGWQVVAVPGLVPDAAFFALLAERKFPAGRFLRRADQMDYIEEPDVFHDVFGHVPMLTHPVFADFMQAYGAGGLRARRHDALAFLARLYWYTVEFGLMETPAGLRIFGAGILSSQAESVFALESPSPNRIGFDLERVMRTDYRIDDFQQSYFVIESFEKLLADAYQDFAPLYRRLAGASVLPPDAVLSADRIFTAGRQTHGRAAVL